MQQNFLISANSFVQRAGIAALSKEGDEAVARMRAVCDKRRKLMVELMRGVGFGIPVMHQGAFYVFADASRWTDDSYAHAFELLEKACISMAPGVDCGHAGNRAVRFSYGSPGENKRRRGGGGKSLGRDEVVPVHPRGRCRDRAPRDAVWSGPRSTRRVGGSVGGKGDWRRPQVSRRLRGRG